MTNVEIELLEQPLLADVRNPGITLGLPANPNNVERRFPLTPEAVDSLVNDFHFKVFIEKGAGHEIHYNDSAYASHGAILTDRTTALGCDIVISAAPLSSFDIKSMRRNAALWTLLRPSVMSRQMLEALNRKGIITLSLTSLAMADGHRPFHDILAEVEGTAAIVVAAGMLADSVHGKGILFGGVTGIIPCEIVIIGADTAGIAAARTALGLGATVRLFDNDPCRLRHAGNVLNGNIIGSSLHRKVYLHALTSADVIVNTLEPDHTRPARIDSTEINILKKGALLFDLFGDEEPVFPALRQTDLSPALDSRPSLTERICFINPGSAVPRTTAMALSNTLMPLLQKLAVSADHTFMDAARMDPFIRTGLITFAGKLINRQAAEATGLNWIDPEILLRLS